MRWNCEGAKINENILVMSQFYHIHSYSVRYKRNHYILSVFSQPDKDLEGMIEVIGEVGGNARQIQAHIHRSLGDVDFGESNVKDDLIVTSKGAMQCHFQHAKHVPCMPSEKWMLISAIKPKLTKLILFETLET